jgi:hypothetical protein
MNLIVRECARIVGTGGVLGRSIAIYLKFITDARIRGCIGKIWLAGIHLARRAKHIATQPRHRGSAHPPDD